MNTKDKLPIFFDTIDDYIADLLYYDRKNDPDLNEHDIVELMKTPGIKDKIIDHIEKCMKVYV